MDWSGGNWIWVLVAIAALGFLMRRGGAHGHGWAGHRRNGNVGHGHTDPHRQPAERGREDGPGGIELAAALDPVSGNPVRTDRGLSAVFEGRAYYFESENTRKRFEAEPQKYATVSSAPVDGSRRQRRGC